MQSIAVLALIICLIMLFRWLGPPVRRLPGEEKEAARHNPEADVPPPTITGIN